MDSVLDNEFVEKTRNALNKKSDTLCIACRGFDLDKLDTKKEECVLVMGLNPAGGKDDAIREKGSGRYFYSFDRDRKINSDWVYNAYFRPIYEFISAALDKDVKWPWCNISWGVLEQEITSDETLKNYKSAIEEEYNNHRKKNCTIYIGDMFYYHETSSQELSKLFSFKDDKDITNYCKEMLSLHIDALIKANKQIKLIYINNAKVSHWLRENESNTWEEYEGVKVFYGGMLSGMRSMDAFSKRRAINEIKKILSKGDSK